MIFNATEGRRVPVYAKLANTTPVVLYQPNVSETIAIIESIRISCRGGGSTFDLYVTNGSSNFYLAEGTAIAANSQFELKDHHFSLINSSWSLVVKDITGNKLDVTGVIFVPMQRKDAERR